MLRLNISQLKHGKHKPSHCLNQRHASTPLLLSHDRQNSQLSQTFLLHLDRISVESLDKDTLLDLIRAYELAFIRLGEPTERVKQQVAKSLHRCFQLDTRQPNHTQPSNQLHGGSGRTRRQNLQLVKNGLFRKRSHYLNQLPLHIVASTDNGGDVFLNGEKVTSCKDWMYPVSEPVKVPFNKGTNTIRVALKNIGACRPEKYVSEYNMKMVMKL